MANRKYTKDVNRIIKEEQEVREGHRAANEPGDCPLPLRVIPNYMGINLCSVDSLSWEVQEDGQLVNLSIKFIPYNKPE